MRRLLVKGTPATRAGTQSRETAFDAASLVAREEVDAPIEFSCAIAAHVGKLFAGGRCSRARHSRGTRAAATGSACCQYGRARYPPSSRDGSRLAVRPQRQAPVQALQ